MASIGKTAPRRTSKGLRIASAAGIAMGVGLLGGGLNHSIAHADSSTSGITINQVNGTFYTNNTDNGTFTGTSGTGNTNTLLFTQNFPLINFNPNDLTYCSNAAAIQTILNANRFTDVVRNSNGTCSTVVAQGGTPTLPPESLSGVRNTSFQATFVSSINVPAAGTYTVQVQHDDGFVLGIGNDTAGGGTATAGSGNTNVAAPSSTYVNHLQVIGAYNANSTGPTDETVIFSKAGTYPIEVDYTESNGLPAQLTFDQGPSNNDPNTPIMPTPELGSGELLATGLVPALGIVLFRRRRQRRAAK